MSEPEIRIPQLIKGGRYADERGKVFYVNDFLMNSCCRFYQITHEDTSFVRAWQGHQIESKWFYCIKGSFDVKLIKPDDWKRPSQSLEVYNFEIHQDNTEVLFIPPGYVNGFRAKEPQSSFIIFSDADLETSKVDDYRFDKDLWNVW